MCWKLVCIVVLFSEVLGQLSLLGLQLPLDLNLGSTKETTTARQNIETPTPPAEGCRPSLTLYPNGEPACSKKLIFEDNFDITFINRNKWITEQYTPMFIGPDYEFVSYQTSEQTLYIRDKKLFLKPTAFTKEEDVKGILDLRDGCTRKLAAECYYEQQTIFILPPVKSAKVSSKFSFTYGKIEVKAKLPSGDWIFPQLELIPRTASKEGLKMWIAYARGNDFYLGPEVGDTGSKVLFGGPVLGVKEPDRSSRVYNRSSAVAYNNEMHVYTLVWEPGQVTVSVDGEIYGTALLDINDRRLSSFNNEFYVSFGVGVGGINDFPDSYVSSRPKPWKNMDRRQFKNFFDARQTWLKTWNGDNSALQIDYVKIWAL